MNKETQELIERLSEKLGTTADHLWGVLIKQAPIQAIIDGITMAALIVLSILALKLFKDKYKKLWDTDAEPLVIVAGLFTAMLVVATIIIVCTTFDTTVTAVFNPEYWALKQIIHK